MENQSNNPDNNKKDQESKKSNDQEKPYEKWKDPAKNNMGNDVTSEIKIANAGGDLEGGDNKQWHMDQGDFDKDEKKDFENSDEKE